MLICCCTLGLCQAQTASFRELCRYERVIKIDVSSAHCTTSRSPPPCILCYICLLLSGLKWQIFRGTEPHCPRNKLKWRRQLTLRWRDEWRGCVNCFLNFHVTRSGKTLAQWFPPASWPVVMLRLINCPGLKTFCSKLRRNNSYDTASAIGTFTGASILHRL